MAKRGKDKKRLEQVENDIKKWKEQGYKIAEIERLVEFVKEHRTPSAKRKVIHIGVISFLVTVIIILTTIPYAIVTGDEYSTSLGIRYEDATWHVGSPLRWISIIYIFPTTNKVDIDKIVISSWSNLVIDFIFFLVIIFVLMSCIYLLIDGQKKTLRAKAKN